MMVVRSTLLDRLIFVFAFCWLQFLFILPCYQAFSFVGCSLPSSSCRKQSSTTIRRNNKNNIFILRNTFYDDFEDFNSNNADNENETSSLSSIEEDLKLEKELRDKQEFREKAANVKSVDEFVKLVSSGGAKDDDEEPKEWAKKADDLQAGVVLIANPDKFDLPSPNDVGGPDRLADALPVLIITNYGKGGLLSGGSEGLVWNQRSTALVGDIERQFNKARQEQQETTGGSSTNLPTPQLGAFMIQPVWAGGNSQSSTKKKDSDLPFDMLHLCPTLDGATKLTNDGIYVGGNPEQAQDIMTDPSKNGVDRPMSGSDFRFFIQTTKWLPLQLENQIKSKQWFSAHVSKDVLFKPRDSIGQLRVKPLWTEIMELLGGEYQTIRDEFYNRE